MIDWIKAIIPFHHSVALNNGIVISINKEGERDWEIGKRMAVVGSHDTRLHIHSDIPTRISSGYTHIVIDGNPAKFLQGHNLWGSDDLIGLVAETVLKVSKILKLPIPIQDWRKIVAGNYKLQRVDSTCMVDLGNQAQVQSFLYSAERTACLRFNGPGLMSYGTLYFGKNSRRESLKMYSKAEEIKAKGHELPNDIKSQNITDWVNGKLRIEVCTRAMGLKSNGLAMAYNWTENTVNDTINRLLGKLEMSKQHSLVDHVFNSLPTKLKGTYQMWKAGRDMRFILKLATFKRHRTALKKYGIDIAIKQTGNDEPSPNIIDFSRVLSPVRCEQIPSWAIGTPLYFAPRHFHDEMTLKIAV